MSKKSSLKDCYNNISAWFDQHRDRTLFEKVWLDAAIMLLPPGGTILDLGCGMGEPIGQYFIDAGFTVTGIDNSEKMLAIGKARCPKINFVLGDMRQISLNEKFDLIIAWHSFFHIPHDDQRALFALFEKHAKPGALLLFTTGDQEGEVWSDNGGQLLYHASLSPEEYKVLLHRHNFTLLNYKISDESCGNATVWLARLKA